MSENHLGPDNDMVICPNCTCQFRAIPVNVQGDLERAGRLLSELDGHLANAKYDEGATARRKIRQIFVYLRLGRAADSAPAAPVGKWLCVCNDTAPMLNFGGEVCQCCQDARYCNDPYCKTETKATQPYR